MQKSTETYLTALREKNYLLFLQWPQQRSVLNTDALIECLLNEWLQQGYEKADMESFVLLYQLMSVYEAHFSPHLHYAMTLMSSVVIRLLELNEFQDRPSLALPQFTQWANDIPAEEITGLFNKLAPLLTLRARTMEYMIFLEGQKDNVVDALYGSRLSMVQRLVKYTQEETQLNSAMMNEVVCYLTQIRALGPSIAEEVYLKRIMPPSLLEHTKQWVTGLAIGFFQLLQSPVEEGVAIENQSKSL